MAEVYKPLFARVLIERELKEKVGSIIIPDAQRKKVAKCLGTVLAVGPAADKSIQVGARVIFGKFAGIWLDEGRVDADNERLFLCQDEDILAILEDGGKNE